MLGAHCDYEDSYPEMLRVFGDAERQEEIRKSGGRHCQMLSVDPEACRKCKLEANPFKKKGDLDAVLSLVRNSDVVDQALNLWRMARYGGGVSDLSPEEFEAVWICDDQHRYHLTRYHAHQTAEVIAKMLGGKKHG